MPQCDSGVHIFFVVVAVLCVVVYPIGIPLAFLVLLHRDERQRQLLVYAEDDGAGSGAARPCPVGAPAEHAQELQAEAPAAGDLVLVKYEGDMDALFQIAEDGTVVPYASADAPPGATQQVSLPTLDEGQAKPKGGPSGKDAGATQPNDARKNSLESIDSEHS